MITQSLFLKGFLNPVIPTCWQILHTWRGVTSSYSRRRSFINRHVDKTKINKRKSKSFKVVGVIIPLKTFLKLKYIKRESCGSFNKSPFNCSCLDFKYLRLWVIISSSQTREMFVIPLFSQMCLVYWKIRDFTAFSMWGVWLNPCSPCHPILMLACDL